MVELAPGWKEPGVSTATLPNKGTGLEVSSRWSEAEASLSVAEKSEKVGLDDQLSPVLVSFIFKLDCLKFRLGSRTGN